MSAPRILVVDDEQIARENLEYILGKEGYEVVAVESGEQALEELEAGEFDLVLTDLRLHRVDGMQVLKRAKELSPDTEVIVITGYATVASAVAAMQQGAYHYLAKPYQNEEVRLLVRQALDKRGLRLEVRELKRQVAAQTGYPSLIGQNAKMVALKETIAQIAPADCNVLILGETGTGKELVARALHALSPRAGKRFLAVNCGAFSEELLASELFGHEKGAFTGAHSAKKGLLEVASGGTFFLDEVGDMPPAMQVKLLRVIQEKTLIRVGGVEEIPVDVRLVAASNKDLRQEVAQGRFRQDLYYRLNVVTLVVPPLAERRDDIPLLCQHFLTQVAARQGKRVEGFAPEVLEVLLHYEFPGNVRELENIIERAVTLATGPLIEVKHLPPDLQQRSLQMIRRQRREFLTLEENEKEYIAWILEQVQGNRTRAAEILGIDRVSLWRKLKRYGLA
ncbi:MAG: sigma-54 dependent transcriptional regulator [Syntrophobacterales bacterium]|nr:sigma-54 dependent transcriptional regulator [Syntrophobacterales bacterium]